MAFSAYLFDADIEICATMIDTRSMDNTALLKISPHFHKSISSMLEPATLP